MTWNAKQHKGKGRGAFARSIAHMVESIEWTKNSIVGEGEVWTFSRDRDRAHQSPSPVVEGFEVANTHPAHLRARNHCEVTLSVARLM